MRTQVGIDSLGSPQRRTKELLLQHGLEHVFIEKRMVKARTLQVVFVSFVLGMCIVALTPWKKLKFYLSNLPYAPTKTYSPHIVQLRNGAAVHCEVIESLITGINEIFPDVSFNTAIFDVHADTDDREYGIYITQKYENVVHYGVTNPSHVLHVTAYPREAKEPYVYSTKYVQHRFDKEYDDRDNVYLIPFIKSLTCNPVLLPTVLPAIGSGYSNTATYIVQGSFSRRDFSVVRNILDNVSVSTNFSIRIIGSSKGGTPGILSTFLEDPRVEIMRDLSFNAYHKAFQGAYGILTCIDRKQNESYYTDQLTSSISYGVGYKLKFVCDSELADLYEIQPQCYTYAPQDEVSICNAFLRSLGDFPFATSR